MTSENLEALAREHHQQKFVHPDQPQVSNECGPGPRTGGAVEAPSLGKSMPIKKHSARVDKPYDSAQRAKRPVSKRSNSFSRSRHFSMTPLDTPIPSPSMSGNTSPAMTPLPGQTPAPSCSDAFISLPTSPIFPSEPGFVNLQDLTFNPPPAGPSPRSNDQSESGTSPGPSADSASVNSSHTSQDVHDMSVDASPSCAPSQLDESRWTSPTESRFPAPEVVPAFNSNSESALPAVNRLVPNEGPVSVYPEDVKLFSIS